MNFICESCPKLRGQFYSKMSNLFFCKCCREDESRRFGLIIPGFALMPDCQNNGQIIIDTVKNDIAAIPERDQPFPKSRLHLVGRTTDSRMRGHDLHPLADCAHGTGCRFKVLRRKKAITSLDTL